MPGFASGEPIVAIAMNEPGAGSDLAGINTTAVRDGDDFIINGSKTLIWPASTLTWCRGRAHRSGSRAQGLLTAGGGA